MPRIVGVDIPDNKTVIISLTYIYGIGPARAQKVVEMARIDPNKRAKALTDEEVSRIHQIIDTEFKVEGALRQEVQQNIRRLKDIASYRGVRHLKSLPVRGQRTRSNARTRKGKRRTVGGLKRKIEKT